MDTNCHIEWLPIITRWELEGADWKNVRFPLNKGASRDIPKDAVLHESVLWRLKNDPTYCPGNNHGGRLPPCLKHKQTIAQFHPPHDPDVDVGFEHRMFEILKPADEIK